MKVIDRKKAAQILKISVRTLDRYIQKGVINKKEIGGRIFINVKDLKPLISKTRFNQVGGSEMDEIEEAQPQTEVGEESQYISPTPSKISSEDDQIYKNLYEEAVSELKVKQERLEGANYRVGQLEAQLKESVPLLDYKKAIADEKNKREELESLISDFEHNTEVLTQSLDTQKIELEKTEQDLQIEKKIKNIFLIILVILFLLQPLWLLFPPA